jgi:hypothetical protein
MPAYLTTTNFLTSEIPGDSSLRKYVPDANGAVMIIVEYDPESMK